jgi:hypothetical protein
MTPIWIYVIAIATFILLVVMYIKLPLLLNIPHLIPVPTWQTTFPCPISAVGIPSAWDSETSINV